MTKHFITPEAGSHSIGQGGNLAQKYLRKAKAFLPDIEILAESGEQVSPGMTMLLSHAFECTLKAYLLHRGMTRKQLRKTKGLDGKSVNHNLEWLWREAVKRGLRADSQPPHWCEKLNNLHNRPYYLRYPSEDTMLLVYPGASAAVSGLKSVIAEVDKLIQ